MTMTGTSPASEDDDFTPSVLDCADAATDESARSATAKRIFVNFDACTLKPSHRTEQRPRLSTKRCGGKVFGLIRQPCRCVSSDAFNDKACARVNASGGVRAR